MANEGQEVPIPQQGPSEHQSLWNRLRSALKISTQVPKTPSTEPVDTVTPLASPDQTESVLPSRQTGIGTTFITNLGESGITTETQDFEKVGVAAQGRTNEAGNPILFEKTRNQEQAPNGYLIGIGAANVFSMLEAFPEGVIPKAILLFDIDPQVVAAGRQIIEGLRNDLEAQVEKAKAPKQVINPGWASDYQAALEKSHPLLRRLAKEGNLVIAQADFTDPRLIDELTKLPDIRTLNNVIYLSNIADHLWRRQTIKSNAGLVPDFSFLRGLQPQLPHRNYYIDTLQTSLDYNLRVSFHPPSFSEHDFLSTDARIQTRPIDEINPPSENPIWEDISQWDLDRLINTYHELSNSPYQQQRRAYIQRRISEGRSDTLSRYDEYKQRAKQPPQEVLPSVYWRYVVPTDPMEEQSLLTELSQPYDYDRDFIPFLAHTLWHDVNFPWQIKSRNLPKRANAILNRETRERTYIVDLREATKGKIEIAWLEAGVPFEELAMAKLYQEAEKRALHIKGPEVAKGKSFEELVKETT